MSSMAVNNLMTTEMAFRLPLTARVPFWPISVPQRVGFSSNVPVRVGFVPLRVGSWKICATEGRGFAVPS